MLEKIIFKFKIFFYKNILKKDSMNIKIEFFRKKGATIGNNVRCFSDIISAEPYLLTVGDNVTISTGVKFTTHDNAAIKIIEGATDLFGEIKIGNNCFIGQNTILLPGVELGKNIVVGAGSVVTKSFLEEGIIIAGNPAKKIGTVDSYKNKYKENIFNTKNMNYNEKKNYILKNKEKLIKK